MTELGREMSNLLTVRDFDPCLTVTDGSGRQKISKTIGCLNSTAGCNEYVENNIPCKSRMHTVSVSHWTVKKLDPLLGLKHISINPRGLVSDRPHILTTVQWT